MKAEQLRKSILQLAIQGKLVPQDPNDEPASVLLERIRAEKQWLIKEGKIKKDKNDSVIFKGDDNRYYEKVGNNPPVCIDDEVSEFDLPDSWVLCRFSFIAEIFTGNSINETEKQKKYTGLTNGYNYIGTKDVSFDHTVNYNNGVKIPFEQSNFRIAHKFTPLLCIEGGSAGRKIGILQEDVCFGNKLCAFESFGVDPKYIYYFLQSPSFTKVFKEKTTGIIGGVSVNTLKHLLFAVPPLAEQARIVAEIEKFEPLITEYDKLEQQATKLDDEIYDKLKKSILQYAIQGKLVPQDPNDEPASVLLKRIRAEKKAKLGKKFVDSYIYKGDDNCYYEHIIGRAQDEPVEVPFDIPDNWEWSKIKYIADTQTGTTPSTSDKSNFGDYISFVKPGDLVNGRILYNREMLSERGLNNGRLIPSNSVIMVCIGGSTGKCALTDRDISCNQQINTASPCKWVLPQYLFFFMTSDYFYKTVRANATGTATPIINRSTWENLVIPIPPLAEQKRIVAKINEIFAMQ